MIDSPACPCPTGAGEDAGPSGQGAAALLDAPSPEGVGAVEGADSGGAGGGAAEEEATSGREDWMTTPMGRSVVAPPAEGGKPDKALAAHERAIIAAVRPLL